MNTDFRNLHIPGTPLVLYNVWDTGSAKAVAKTKPAAIATGSWAMAKAQGYDDGEEMPFNQVVHTVAQIAKAVDLPVTVDFETGYAEDLETIKTNIEALSARNIVGVNIEDRLIGKSGLRSVKDQCARIEVLNKASHDLFINARCDLMFDGSKPDVQAEHIDELLERAKAYADSGADGLFVPGLADPHLIEEVCKLAPLPVNIMRMNDTPISELAALGVARISHGPRPYIQLMQSLSDHASAL